MFNKSRGIQSFNRRVEKVCVKRMESTVGLARLRRQNYTSRHCSQQSSVLQMKSKANTQRYSDTQSLGKEQLAELHTLRNELKAPSKITQAGTVWKAPKLRDQRGGTVYLGASIGRTLNICSTLHQMSFPEAAHEGQPGRPLAFSFTLSQQDIAKLCTVEPCDINDDPCHWPASSS